MSDRQGQTGNTTTPARRGTRENKRQEEKSKIDRGENVMTTTSEAAKHWTPPQRRENKTQAQRTEGQGRKAYKAESRLVNAIEEAIQAQVPNTKIDFEAARERELATFEPTQVSPLYLEVQRLKTHRDERR